MDVFGTAVDAVGTAVDVVGTAVDVVLVLMALGDVSNVVLSSLFVVDWFVFLVCTEALSSWVSFFFWASFLSFSSCFITRFCLKKH